MKSIGTENEDETLESPQPENDKLLSAAVSILQKLFNLTKLGENDSIELLDVQAKHATKVLQIASSAKNSFIGGRCDSSQGGSDGEVGFPDGDVRVEAQERFTRGSGKVSTG